jgi:hypothetical protein
LKEPRAVPVAVAALDDRATQLAALELIGELGGPEQAAAVARRAPPADVLAVAVRSLSEGVSAATRSELERAVAEIHGATGTLVRWAVSGPVTDREAAGIVEKFARVPTAGTAWPDWSSVLASAPEWRVHLGPSKGATGDAVWFAHAGVVAPDTRAVEFALTGAGPRRCGSTASRSTAGRSQRPTGTPWPDSRENSPRGRTVSSSGSAHPERSWSSD